MKESIVLGGAWGSIPAWSGRGLGGVVFLDRCSRCYYVLLQKHIFFFSGLLLSPAATHAAAGGPATAAVAGHVHR